MLKWIFKHHKPLKHCGCWDELNSTCMWEHMERIVQPGYQDDKPAWGNPAACFDEMD